MKKVFIVGPNFFHYFQEMYTGRGYEIVSSIEEADIVQFTGGEDISPALYGEYEHPSSGPSLRRDEKEIEAYKEARRLGKFCAGVCRGGQLLNVLSGGKMYQHVNNHATGKGHDAIDVRTGDVFPVSSLHHQMMIMGEGAELLAKATTTRSQIKLGMTTIKSGKRQEVVTDDDELEVEACYYPSTKSFCYQPHPEFVSSNHPCREWYFSTLEELVKV